MSEAKVIESLQNRLADRTLRDDIFLFLKDIPMHKKIFSMHGFFYTSFKKGKTSFRLLQVIFLHANFAVR